MLVLGGSTEALKAVEDSFQSKSEPSQSLSRLSLQLNAKDPCVSLTLCAALHYPVAKFSPPSPTTAATAAAATIQQ